MIEINLDVKMIRKIINQFRLNNIYEFETALLIYELVSNKDIIEISDEEIQSVYDFVYSQDNIFDEYVENKIVSIFEDKEVKNELEYERN